MRARAGARLWQIRAAAGNFFISYAGPRRPVNTDDLRAPVAALRQAWQRQHPGAAGAASGAGEIDIVYVISFRLAGPIF